MTRLDNTRPERPPDDLNTYGDFVGDVVTHFKGQVHYYQIWNEPNIYPEWGARSPDPAAYVRLLRIAYQRAKEADPNVVILSAPLAQTLENSTKNESDLQVLGEAGEADPRRFPAGGGAIQRLSELHECPSVTDRGAGREGLFDSHAPGQSDGNEIDVRRQGIGKVVTLALGRGPQFKDG